MLIKIKSSCSIKLQYMCFNKKSEMDKTSDNEACSSSKSSLIEEQLPKRERVRSTRLKGYNDKTAEEFEEGMKNSESINLIISTT